MICLNVTQFGERDGFNLAFFVHLVQTTCIMKTHSMIFSGYIKKYAQYNQQIEKCSLR